GCWEPRTIYSRAVARLVPGRGKKPPPPPLQPLPAGETPPEPRERWCRLKGNLLFLMKNKTKSFKVENQIFTLKLPEDLTVNLGLRHLERPALKVCVAKSSSSRD
ncbi:hypothetical protein JRQ81_016687, partial [Phrynocephalus forsythii]